MRLFRQCLDSGYLWKEMAYSLLIINNYVKCILKVATYYCVLSVLEIADFFRIFRDVAMIFEFKLI